MSNFALFTSALVILTLFAAQKGHSLDEVDLKKCRVAECGKTGPNFVQTRIIGGRLAREDEFPFHVAVWSTNKTSQILCGGNVINDRWILTAGNCIKRHYQVPVEELRVSAGILDLKERATNEIKVQSAWVHPSHKQYNVYHDIALIKTTESIAASSKHHVNPICLPFEDFYSKSAQVATVVGFGATKEHSRLRSKLRTANVNVLSPSICESTYKDYKYFDHLMVCAGDLQNGKDTCTGDAGGPLAVKNDEGLYIIKGITSYGEGCGRKDTPAVYTNVSYYLEWVCKTMLKEGLE